MKRVALAGLIAVAIAALVAWRVWSRGTAQPTPRDAAAVAVAKPPSGGAAPAPVPESRVRKLGSEERKLLGEKIRAAIARSRTTTPSGAPAHAGSAAPPGEEPTIPLEEVIKPVFDALKDALPLVADCYKQYGTDKRAAALMTMVSDPELGTVIDTETITDGDGKPINPKLDDCMRNTIDALALPPLGQPGKLKVQYTFRFDDE